MFVDFLENPKLKFLSDNDKTNERRLTVPSA